MRASTRVLLAIGALVAVGSVSGPASAITVDLALVLPNSGYENGTTSSWSTTKPNLTSGWVNSVPVDPSIAPLDPCCNNGTTLPLLLAPNGSHFVGVATTDFAGDTLDEKGKLVHDAISVSYASGTEFQVTIWANRGRIGTDGNTNSALPASPPTLSVNLSGWTTPGSPPGAPTVDVNDNWSRTRQLNMSSTFTNWGTPGQWTSQTFSWIYTGANPLLYISLSISGQNNNHSQYVAWDLAPVPEPSTALLLGVGLVAMAARRRAPRP